MARKPHNCGYELEDAQRANTAPSTSTAIEGTRWTCSCGLTYVHVCDESKGCYWSRLRHLPAEDSPEDGA